MKIACLLADNFEDSEFEQPCEAYKAAGHQVTLIGFEAGKEVRGAKGRVTATIEKSIQDVSPSEFDALFIPGGQAPDRLRANDKVVEFTRAFMEAGKPVFAICHGPQLLLTADQYRGWRMTAWKTVQGDLRKAGADVVDEPVVIDRNLVTSRQPDDIPAFIEGSLAVLQRAPAGAASG